MTTDSLRSALASKLRMAELRQKIAAEKLSLSNYEQRRREMERRALSGRTLAKPTAASRPATRSTPAPAPQHPHLAKLASLSGTEATNFYRQHRSAIVAEEADRKQAIAEAQLKANCRLAKTGRGFNSHI